MKRTSADRLEDLSIMIAPRGLKSIPAFCKTVASFELYGRTIPLALVRTRRPHFDAGAPRHRDKALLRVHAFSCNFRDRAIALDVADFAERNPDSGFVGIGSEFVARVEAVGARVQGLRIGDHVISDANYPDSGLAASEGGIPTNRASSRYLILSAKSLMRVPGTMDPAAAAAFTIGSQTSYSILRRLQLSKGMRVLVTSASSNTSLFVLQALKRYKVSTFASTSSKRHLARINKLGVKHAFLVQRGSVSGSWSAIDDFCKQAEGFDAVIDPFYDLNLRHAARFIRPFGTYVTCGYQQQHGSANAEDRRFETGPIDAVLPHIIGNNISIIGNCLGKTIDLKTALADYARRKLVPPIDSTFRPHQMAAFFRRSFTDGGRFGKVVMIYE